jgi:deoxyribodipyrimidine photo-lyase
LVQAVPQNALGRILPRCGMDRYDKARDFPALKGPSYLSVYISVLERLVFGKQFPLAYQHSNAGAQTWLSEDGEIFICKFYITFHM